MKRLYNLLKGIVVRAILKADWYYYLVSSVIPFIRFSFYYTSFKGQDFYRGYNILRPGDIVLSTDDKKLTSVIIGGDFSHAALCVTKDEIFEIAEMTRKNYTKSTFFDTCKESTHVLIIRCEDWDKEYINNIVIPRCLGFQDAKYDVEFKIGVKNLYCSELIYMSDYEKRLQVNLEDLAGIGREYISPTGLYKAKNIRVVWDSNSTSKRG
jgi:hypothetical protein